MPGPDAMEIASVASSEAYRLREHVRELEKRIEELEKQVARLRFASPESA